MNEVLRLEHVEKFFRGQRVLHDVSFSLNQGSAVGLLGPNGSGKSTLLKIAVGLIRPEKGDVAVFGKPPTWEAFDRLSYMPDRGHFAKEMTVGEAVSVAGKLYGRFDKKEIERILEDARISSNKYLTELSKGQEARFHIGLCVARRPELLVLDEPFAGLDILSREAMSETIIGAIADGIKAVLISTHDLEDVEGLFDEVILLNDGQVVIQEKAETLRARYGSNRQMFKELIRQ